MYDIIGDVHGCYTELLDLLERLGYVEDHGLYHHPEKRELIFIGDLTDRGSASVRVLQLVIRNVRHQKAIYVPGNHCNKLYRLFLGRNVQITNGLETTIAELGHLPPQTKKRLKNDFVELVEASPYYRVLDGGKLVVSHAGIRGDMIGQVNNKVKTFCLYGDITGEKDKNGFPIRRDWAREYTGESWIVYGHTPVKNPRYIGHTVNIDTGCVFGGHLTGLRYPEMTVEMVRSTMPYVAEKFRFNSHH